MWMEAKKCLLRRRMICLAMKTDMEKSLKPSYSMAIYSIYFVHQNLWKAENFHWDVKHRNYKTIQLSINKLKT